MYVRSLSCLPPVAFNFDSAHAERDLGPEASLLALKAQQLLSMCIAVLHERTSCVPRLTTADADIPVEGTYDPPVGVLSLTTQSGDRRGELIFDVAVSDVGSVAVASEQRHINGRGAQRARAVFATDRDKKATLERIAVLSAAFEGWRPDMEKGSCPAALAAWRDEALAFQETRRDPVEQYDIFYTDAFRKAFGAPYETVDPERLKQNASLLRGACRPEDRVRGNETNQLAYMIGLGQPHQDHLLWRLLVSLVQPPLA